MAPWLWFVEVATDGWRSSARVEDKFAFWQLVLAALHLAAATGVLATTAAEDSNWEVPVYSRFNVWRPINASEGEGCDAGCVIHEYERHVGDLNMALAVALFSFISGTHHLWATWFTRRGTYNTPAQQLLVAEEETRGTTDQKKYPYLEHVVKSYGVCVPRWIDYFLSASLMLMVDSVLWKAPPSTMQMIYVPALMGGVIIGGYGSEVAWAASAQIDKQSDIRDLWRRHSKALFLLSCVPFACAWGLSVQLFAEAQSDLAGATPVRGAGVPVDGKGAEPPAFVYAIFVLIFVTYVSFPLAHARRIFFRSADNTVQSAVREETVYAFLSFLAKVPLLVVYSAAVAGRSRTVSIEGRPNPPGGGDMVTTAVSSGVSVCLSGVLAFVMWRHLANNSTAPTPIRQQ